MNITTPPPDKLSDLIRLALGDLRKCEESPNYRINMIYWHLNIPDESRCIVCLAGSVMAQTLQFQTSETFNALIHQAYDGLDSTAHRWVAGMYALNAARQGWVADAMCWWLDCNEGDVIAEYARKYDHKVPYYSDDPIGFHDALTHIADLLSADGL